MASRAVVFRPINGDDVSITPFEANTTFKETNESYLASLNNYSDCYGKALEKSLVEVINNKYELRV